LPKRLPANPRTDDTLTDKAISWCSTGQYGYKSLALAGFTSTLTEVETPTGTGSWSIAADHPAGFGILGIWACPEPPHHYSDEIINSLDAYAGCIRSHAVVIAGDFNITYDGTERHKFRTVLERLADLDMISAYHAHTGVEHGAEAVDTHFFRTHQDARFHIDFVFIPKSWTDRIRNVEVGTHAKWVASGLSDHVPIVVDVDP
jgi:Endonuclease/Exonuclease/phosphatase family